MINSENIQKIKVKNGNLFSNEIANLKINDIDHNVFVDLDHRLVYLNYMCRNDNIYTHPLDEKKYGYSYYAYMNSSVIRLLESKFSFEEKIFYIDDILYEFIKDNNLISFFKYKLESFSDYDTFEIVKNNNLLKISNSLNGNKLELKIGRFLTKINTYLNILSPKEIEQISLKYKTLCDEDIIFDFLVGEDIIEGYKTSNYEKSNNSSLWGSCMNDKTSYLNIYTKNTNIVKLAVLKKNAKILARCFVWKVNDNFYYDKIYHYKEYHRGIMIQNLESNLIKPIKDLGFASIKLDFCNFSMYPYLDTFYLLDMENKSLIYFDPDREYRLLHDQHGEYTETSFNYSNEDY